MLLRHPGAVVASLVSRRAEPDLPQIHAEVLEYGGSWTRRGARRRTSPQLRAAHDGAGKVTREICDFLGVEWEAGMLDYGQHDHGEFRPHIGDWSETIKSGRIQPSGRVGPYPGLPPRLSRIAEGWGYET